MEVKLSPQIEIDQEGNSFKVLRVKGTSGMCMPNHHSTREAVLIWSKRIGNLVYGREGLQN